MTSIVPLILSTVALVLGGEYGADFDYFMLTLQYPTDNCLADNDAHENSCQIPIGTLPWTIHGLWPNFENGSYPQNCRGNPQRFDPAQISSIESKLTQVWPNILVGKGKSSFWKHEYEKHGTCAQSDPLFDTELKYFERSMDARSKLDIAKILSPIGPSETPVKKSEIQRLIKEAIGGHEFQIHCLRDHKLNAYLLSDIRVCLTKDLQFRDCPHRHASSNRNRVSHRPRRSNGRKQLPMPSECPETISYLKELSVGSTVSIYATISLIAFTFAYFL